MPKNIKILFYALLVTFALTMLTIFTNLIELSSYLFPSLLLLCFLLGLILLVLSIKLKKSKLKILLILNSSSLLGIPVLSVIHNLFYALQELGNNEIFVKLLGILEGTFFIISVLVCPVVFVVTTVWILILMLRKDK